MASLYEIEEQILNCVDLETGEIIDEEALANLSMERDTKVENIALWIKNLLAEAKMVKEEKDNLANRQKVCENKAESLIACCFSLVSIIICTLIPPRVLELYIHANYPAI